MGSCLSSTSGRDLMKLLISSWKFRATSLIVIVSSLSSNAFSNSYKLKIMTREDILYRYRHCGIFRRKRLVLLSEQVSLGSCNAADVQGPIVSTDDKSRCMWTFHSYFKIHIPYITPCWHIRHWHLSWFISKYAGISCFFQWGKLSDDRNVWANWKRHWADQGNGYKSFILWSYVFFHTQWYEKNGWSNKAACQIH